MPASVWMKAMVLLIFAYGGFESALAPMSEAKSPGRDAAFALFVALIACTVIYAMVQWVVVGVLGPWATTDRPLAEVAPLLSGIRLFAETHSRYFNLSAPELVQWIVAQLVRAGAAEIVDGVLVNRD